MFTNHYSAESLRYVTTIGLYIGFCEHPINCTFEKTKFMKLLYLILFIPFVSICQITVDVNDFADGGDTVRLSTANNPGIDFTTTGANMSWDFSDLSAEGQELVEYKDVSLAGPLVSFTFGAFADETYQATNYTAATDIPLDAAGQFLPININEVNQFAKHSDSAVGLVGLAINVEGNDIPVPSDTIETKYVLPLNFGDAYNSRGYTYLNMNPIFNLIWIQYRQRSSTVDGWGSISTPYGTFDCIRVKHEIAETDSVLIDFAGTGTPIWIELPVPPSVEYEWIAKNELAPVLSIRTTNAGGNETVTQIKYRDIYLGLDAGINENTLNLNVGPNPVENELMIKGLKGDEIFDICSLDGKVVLSGKLMNQGSFAQIDMSTLHTGAYLLHVGKGTKSFTQRIIKL
jgi:hypothetical protein